MNTSSSKVQSAIAAIKSGRMIIITDDDDREGEGDLVIAASAITPEAINFMATYARGLICIPMMEERLNELNLPQMVQHNNSRHTTAFTVSVDAVHGVTTGISSQDRATTVQTLSDPSSTPDSLARPGHIFPLAYTEGGVLVRAGHTEASIDFVRLAGLYPASVICEIMDSNGNMARGKTLKDFASKHNLPIVSVSSLISYRRSTEKLISRRAEARVPTPHGSFKAISYKSIVDNDEHIALVRGKITRHQPTLVRVHSECLTGDVFGSLRCDCGEQMNLALQAISQEKTGVFLYMRQEGRGIGIHNKLKAYSLQDQGMDTVEANLHLGFPADLRHFGVGAQILADIGVRKMRLLTNNPKKIVGLESFDLKIIERVPIVVKPNNENKNYLDTKQSKMGHIFDNRKFVEKKTK